MQKIFLVQYKEDISQVNDFINPKGKIVSVDVQKVGGEGSRGYFLIVADNGKGEKISL
jgi:hypothetical protein